MAYPWEFDSKNRVTYNENVDPGVEKQSLAAYYSWSSIASRLIGIPTLSLAVPGNSNTNAINRIVHCINQFKLTNSLVVLGLTQEIRHDIPNENNILKPTVIKPSVDFSESEKVFEHSATNEEIQQYNESWYKVKFSKDQVAADIFVQLEMLSSFIETRGGKLAVINNLFYVDLDNPKLVGKRDYFHIFNNNVKYNWPKYIESYDSNYNLNQHPNTYDHHKLAELILNRYFNYKKSTHLI